MALDAPRDTDLVFDEQGVTVVLTPRDQALLGDLVIEYWGPLGAGFIRARCVGPGRCA